VTSFTDATAVHPVDGGARVDVDERYTVGRHPNGGYLLAALARAVLTQSPHPHPVAVTAHFLRPPACASADVRLMTLRSGRTTATHRATLEQDGQLLLDAVVTTSTLAGSSDPSWAGDVAAPDLPPVERCVAAVADLPTGRVPLLDEVDLRLDPACLGWVTGQRSGQPEMRSWLRMRDGDEPDPLIALLAVDALPPTVWHLSAPGWAPTVELTWHLRALPASGWLQVRTHSTLVQDGWYDEEGAVWDARGRLVAQSRQLARMTEAR
jgi:acyl-CoA thioesterase